MTTDTKHRMELEAWVRDGRPDWLPEKAVREYADWVGFEYAVETVEEAFNGQWGSEEEFAWDLADNLGYLDGPEYFRPPRHYFDIEAFARDLFCGDYFMTASGYVFRSM